VNISGSIPNTFVAMTSCDMTYLRDHGPAFTASVAKAGNSCHIHTVNPSPNYHFSKIERYFKNAFEKLRINETQNITFTTSKFNIRKLSNEEIRTYYACSRFLVAERLLHFGCNSLFITDIDCVFMFRVDPPNTDLGIFLRNSLPGTVGWESEGTKVAAGAVYYSEKMLYFAQEVATTIMENPLVWFLDQVALSKAYEKHKDHLAVHKYTKDFLDWEFLPKTTIWTGKGLRKHDNLTYVYKKNEFTKMFDKAVV